MRSASTEFNQYVSSGGLFYIDAVVEFANGRTLKLNKNDFYISGNSFTDGAGASSLPVGVAISQTLQICLVNDTDRFSEYDFYKSVFEIHAYSDEIRHPITGDVERIELGQYTVITPENYGSKITLTAVDDMYKADVDYTTDLVFPQTIKAILRDSVNRIGIDLLDEDIPYPDYIIQNKPENITHRQLYGFVAMMIGGNAKIKRSGNYNLLKFINYNRNFLSKSGIDGGNLENYSSGDNADGGNFSDYNSGDKLDGGDFYSLRTNHLFTLSQSGNVSTDDVIITGIRVHVGSDSYLYGSEGYVLELNNDLITKDTENVIKGIGTALVGLRFRPFTTDTTANPLVEFADNCYVTDRKGNVYKSIVTDVEFAWFGKTKVKCSAEPPLRNSSKYLSTVEQNFIKETNGISEKVDKIEKEQGTISEQVETVKGQISALSANIGGVNVGKNSIYTLDGHDISCGLTGVSDNSAIEYSIWAGLPDGNIIEGELISNSDAGWGVDSQGNMYCGDIYATSDFITVVDDIHIKGELQANGGLSVPKGVDIDFNSDVVLNGNSMYFDKEQSKYIKLDRSWIYVSNDTRIEGTVYVDGITIYSGSNINFYSPLKMHECEIELNDTFKLSAESDNVNLKFNNNYHHIFYDNGRMTIAGDNGGLEIFHKTTPYIDFHYENNDVDYTARILESTSGALTVYNSISNASDERLKKDIVSLSENLTRLIDTVEPKQYRFKKGDKYLKLGFIAQEMEQAMNDLGIEDKPIVAVPESEDGYYALDYNDLIAILWQDARNQHDENKALKEEIKALKETVNKLVEKVGV